MRMMIINIYVKIHWYNSYWSPTNYDFNQHDFFDYYYWHDDAQIYFYLTYFVNNCRNLVNIRINPYCHLFFISIFTFSIIFSISIFNLNVGSILMIAMIFWISIENLLNWYFKNLINNLRCLIMRNYLIIIGIEIEIEILKDIHYVFDLCGFGRDVLNAVFDLNLHCPSIMMIRIMMIFIDFYYADAQ